MGIKFVLLPKSRIHDSQVGRKVREIKKPLKLKRFYDFSSQLVKKYAILEEKIAKVLHTRIRCLNRMNEKSFSSSESSRCLEWCENKERYRETFQEVKRKENKTKNKSYSFILWLKSRGMWKEIYI